MKYISLEHVIRNKLSGQEVQTDDAQQIDELVSAPVLKQSGMSLLKSFLKPKVKPPSTVPSIPLKEPAKPSVPQVKPATPEPAPAAKPAEPSVKTTTPSTDPTPDKKPEDKPTPKEDPKSDAPPQGKVDQKVDDKDEEEKKRRRDFTMDDSSPQSSSTYKKARVAVNTTVGIAKKRTTKLYSEDLETKNRRLVAVVKKTVDDKKNKDKSGKNPLVDMHPTLKEPDQNQDERR